MPYSKQTFPYTGGARTFTISLALGYIREGHIQVYVHGELDGEGAQIYRAHTFDSEFVVNVTDAITNPSTVTVERTVAPDVFEVDFEAGADITNRNVMIAFRQNFHLMQEILDGRVDGIDIDQRATDAETAAAAAAVDAAAAAASAASIDVNELIHRDGSVDFTAVQIGVAPTLDLHLATKKYVDDTASASGAMLLDGTTQMTAAMLLKAATDPTLDDHAARKAYVDNADALKANLVSPTFTGTPLAPTAAPATNNTQIATTAYADAAAGVGAVLIATSTPSSVASVAFIDLEDYISLWISTEDIDIASAALDLTMSDDNGATYHTSYLEWFITDGGDGGFASTNISVHTGNQNDVNILIPIYNTHNTGKTQVGCCLDGNTVAPSGNVLVRGGFDQSTAAIDAVKLSVASGVINNGTIRIFGVKG